MKNEFVTDVKEMREKARAQLDKGAVTGGYRPSAQAVVELLNAALATELVCVLRYRRHHFMAKGIHAGPVATEFLEHSMEELAHADLLATRITQLGGEPDFAPDGLSARSHAEYKEGRSLRSMIEENLIAERIAIDSYVQMIKYLGENDPTTRRLLEGILASEEEHADDMARILERQHFTRPHESVASELPRSSGSADTRDSGTTPSGRGNGGKRPRVVASVPSSTVDLDPSKEK